MDTYCSVAGPNIQNAKPWTRGAIKCLKGSQQTKHAQRATRQIGELLDIFSARTARCQPITKIQLLMKHYSAKPSSYFFNLFRWVLIFLLFSRIFEDSDFKTNWCFNTNCSMSASAKLIQSEIKIRRPQASAHWTAQAPDWTTSIRFICSASASVQWQPKAKSCRAQIVSNIVIQATNKLSLFKRVSDDLGEEHTIYTESADSWTYIDSA